MKMKAKSYKLKPRIIVMSGYGLNCEEETKFAFERAGGEAEIVHINDLIARPSMLAQFDILAFPGGFSYGDDTGSGKAYANKFKNHLSNELKAFLERDTLAIGICNGFQILTNLGILPGALAANRSGLYIDRWVDLQVPSPLGRGREGSSPWLRGIKKISLPIAHGEGRYVLNEKEYKNLKKNGQIAFTYVRGEIARWQKMPANPNGSLHGIAGVLGYNRRVLGLMPHPERAMFFHHHPMWQNKKNERKGDEGEGVKIFRNAIDYFKNGAGSNF